MSDNIILMPEFSSRGIHPKGWGDVKPAVRHDTERELSELAWKFQIKVTDVFEDAAEDGMLYGDDLHLHLVDQMNNALLIAKYVQHGHLDLAASRLAQMAGDYMEFGEGRSKYADKVWRLCEKFAEDAGMNECDDQNGQIDTQRPGLF